MAFTPITSRADAQPSDLSSRLMARLFPQNGGLPQAPRTDFSGGIPGGVAMGTQSPTGLPISVPPPRMAPTAAPQAASAPALPMPSPTAAPAAPTAPSPPTAGSAGDYYNQIMGPSPWTGHDIVSQLGTKLFNSGPYANQAHSLANQWANEPEIDYSGEGQIGRYYDASRSRQAAMDAAMGRSGGGVGAAGQAALFGSEGHDIGDYVRQLIAQRQQEHEAELNQLRGFGQQLSLAELQRQWAKQDSPGFGQQLLGVLGGVAGKAAGAYFGKP